MKKILPIILTLLLLSTANLFANAKGNKSPFLVQSKELPHYTKKLMKMWDNEKLALSKEQKKQLLKVRKETIKAIKSLKPKIIKLQKKIIQQVKKKTPLKKLQKELQQLANLKKKASMAHFKCIYKTRAILKPKQLQLLER